MRVLALDTTRTAASVAFVDQDRVLAAAGDAGHRSQAEKLPGLLLDALREAGATLADVDAFAVASGPGSFTGLRIGIATIQGLALVCRRPVVPVSALEALACDASTTLPPGTSVGAWLDARRREVFAALYQVGDAPPFARGRLKELDAALVAAPQSVLQRWAGQFRVPEVLAGDGASAYETLIRSVHPAVRLEPGLILAPAIARLAWRRAQAGDAVPPAGVQPLYVRRPDAEIARDARSDGAAAPR